MSSATTNVSGGLFPGPRSEDLAPLIAELTDIRSDMHDNAARVPAGVHDNFRSSAVNLLQYLALRHRDLRPLQGRLAELGLSSLGRSESHVLASVESVLATVHRLAGSDGKAAIAPTAAPGFQQGPELLREHTERLLGASRAAHNPHIMVTMPTDAATDYRLVHELLACGMDSMRINCAHDGPEIWSGMIDNLRRAERALGRTCRISMDLAGPKLRTGPVLPGPAVVKSNPQRVAGWKGTRQRISQMAPSFITRDQTRRNRTPPCLTGFARGRAQFCCIPAIF